MNIKRGGSREPKKAVSTAPAPVPMKRTGRNLEKFQRKKKKKKKKLQKNAIIWSYSSLANPTGE